MMSHLEHLNFVPFFESLNGETLISKQISDHHILIKGPILNANMLMKCRWSSRSNRFNNGFAMEESPDDYKSRIAIFVRVLAECATYHCLQVIALQEAPIEQDDIALFIHEASLYPSLAPFIPSMKIQTTFSSMGIATFFNFQTCYVISLNEEFIHVSSSLLDRVQSFLVISTEGKRAYKFVNTHFPYDLAKKEDYSLVIKLVKKFIALQKTYTDYPVVIAGDFNLHPQKIIDAISRLRGTYRENNSVLVVANKDKQLIKNVFDTVDAIFLTDDIFQGYPQGRYHVRYALGKFLANTQIYLCCLKKEICRRLTMNSLAIGY